MITKNVRVPIEDAHIQSTMYTPQGSKVIVLVSHEPGSGRFNHRNRQLGKQFYGAGLATLLLDWNKIMEIEERKGDFNPVKMAKNLAGIVHWLRSHQTLKHLSAVLYGSSTGAASALIAATEVENSIQAVISRNGRLELAETYLEKIKSPTFIAVGKKDYRLLESNKKAYEKLRCPKKFVALSGICPFFEESEKVEQLGKMAITWINKHSLGPTDTSSKLNHQLS